MNTNVSALAAMHTLSQAQFSLNKSLAKLSSGSRLNRAADGAAQLAISEVLTSQLRGYDAASNNVQQGVSLLQTADGALQGITGQLQRARELAVSAANGTNSADEYAAYQTELQQVLGGIDAVANGTRFNDKTLLNGSIAATPGSLTLQVGPNTTDTLDVSDAFANNTSGAGGLGITQTTLASPADATTLIGQLDQAISSVSESLSRMGGYANRLDSQTESLAVARVNVASTNASIRDTDVAAETAELTRQLILRHASIQSLKQSDPSSQLILGLLRSS